MDIEQFNFDLPNRLIAQAPLKKRTASRLLVVNRDPFAISHKLFPCILDYIRPGDCLVLNDTKVLPARLYGIKKETGAKIEMLLLEDLGSDDWLTLTKPARKIKVGDVVTFGDGMLEAVCTMVGSEGKRTYQLKYNGILFEILDQLGEMPLPPYIKEQLEEKDRYQTVYSKKRGSSAAPTAGLHFTEELLNKVKEKGANLAFVTLHVGLGTFRPVNVTDVKEHDMHSEYYELDEQNAELIQNTKSKGSRIFSVGTTSTRVLETIASKHDGKIVPEKGWTDIFIYPPYSFRAVDALVTNFHLPKSTLLMLVSAFSNRDQIFKAYEEAIQQKYRFFSFGDAMLII